MAGGEVSEDGAAGGVCECGEGEGERIGWHGVGLFYRMVKYK